MLYLFQIDVIFYQVELLVFYNAQTIKFIFIVKIWEIQIIDIVLCKSK